MMMGGTELSMLHLRERVEVPDSVHLHLSVVDEAALSVSKRHVVWLHQSYDQPSVQNLPRVVDRLDHLVFVSHWQREQYRRYLLPSLPLEKTTVIRNAVALPRDYPASHAELRDSSVTRLIYSSTPFRGLDVLLDAMDLVRDDAIHLDVYSSMRVYGPSHARLDSQFEHLYERCRSDSRVTYHGSVDQTTLHRAFASRRPGVPMHLGGDVLHNGHGSDDSRLPSGVLRHRRAARDDGRSSGHVHSGA